MTKSRGRADIERYALTYRSGERVELGDIVMQPENGDTMGVVVDVILPSATKAIATYGVPSGGVMVKWDGCSSEVLLHGVDVLHGPDYLFFVRRESESPKTPPTYRSGEGVKIGDIVMRPEAGETRGVVVEVILPYSANAIWHDVRSGGALIKWDDQEAEVSMGLDVLRQEVHLCRRRS